MFVYQSEKILQRGFAFRSSAPCISWIWIVNILDSRLYFLQGLFLDLSRIYSILLFYKLNHAIISQLSLSCFACKSPQIHVTGSKKALFFIAQ